MSTTDGDEMYRWTADLFPINRSLTGDGVRKTLQYIKSVLPNLQVTSVPSGTSAYDWVVPKEWNMREAWIADSAGNKLIDFATNNLHVVGYSTPVDRIVTRSELELYLHSLPNQPNAIPYVTSYYKECFGFCLTQIQRDSLGEGPFHIYIDSDLFDGELCYGELVIPGKSEKEILFSTYICHPSMANNELSGPAVSMALAKYVQGLRDRQFTYRFLFTVETIGSILYISKNLERMSRNLKNGWVLTCLGDDNSYSYVPTRNGKTLTDSISKRVLADLGKSYIEYSWLDRGSDERQFNAPGVDLPVASLMRSKYGTFPEYHTSLDNLDFISPDGLKGSLEMFKNVVTIVESNGMWKIKVLCEPQLGKRGLYPNTSTKDSNAQIRDQMNIISYLDGNSDFLQIADKCNLSYNQVLNTVEKLNSAGLVEKIDN
jgi:aminopeptidase-like protein